MLDDIKVLQRRQRSGLTDWDIFGKVDRSVQVRSGAGGCGTFFNVVKIENSRPLSNIPGSSAEELISPRLFLQHIYI